ncbi:hypothetical protein HK102_012425 [Quaeritorhiza haematococci]|nr:hypothetical protein HK102_012425 [Quaeritorhiza haematococci]
MSVAAICGNSVFCKFGLEHVLPTLGGLTAVGIFVSPWGSMQQVLKSKSIGSVNPLMMPMMISNCLVFCLYGLLLRNFYVIAPSIVGTVTGTYFTMIAFAVGSARQQFQMFVLFAIGTVSIYSAACLSFIAFTGMTSQTIMGWSAVLILSAFYTFPLGTFYVYGFVLGDPFMWGPNLVGTIVGFISVAFCFIFPRKPTDEDEVNITDISYQFDEDSKRNNVTFCPPSTSGKFTATSQNYFQRSEAPPAVPKLQPPARNISPVPKDTRPPPPLTKTEEAMEIIKRFRLQDSEMWTQDYVYRATELFYMEGGERLATMFCSTLDEDKKGWIDYIWEQRKRKEMSY